MYFHVYGHVDLHRGIVKIPLRKCVEVKGLVLYFVLILGPIFPLFIFYPFISLFSSVPTLMENKVASKKVMERSSKFLELI